MTKINFGKGINHSKTYVWIDSEPGSTSEITFAERRDFSELHVKHRDGGPPRMSPDPLTLLFIGANTGDQAILKLEEELRAIHLAVAQSPARHAIRIIAVLAARPRDLLDALTESRPQVLHFAGHGLAAGDLLFKTDSGTHIPVPIEALAAALDAADPLSLVVANACFSSALTKVLIRHAACAISMRRPISDAAAITFAAALYRALAAGRTVQKSHAAGIAALKLHNFPEADTPEYHSAIGVDPAVYALVTTAGDRSVPGLDPRPRRDRGL